MCNVVNCEETNCISSNESDTIDTSKWELEQKELAKLVNSSNEHITNSLEKLSLVGGLDISYCPENKIEACVSLVVLKYPSLEIVYSNKQFVKITQPYVAGFLGFRETEHFQMALEKLHKEQPLYVPQVILIDGNGILHARKFGSASHFGVKCNIPTIGVAKSLQIIPELGIYCDETHKNKIKMLKNQNDNFPITTSTNEVLGMALLTGSNSKKPVYVSVGHNCDLDTALKIVSKCSPSYKIPEPIRQADMLSRKEIRERSFSRTSTTNCK